MTNNKIEAVKILKKHFTNVKKEIKRFENVINGITDTFCNRDQWIKEAKNDGLEMTFNHGEGEITVNGIVLFFILPKYNRAGNFNGFKLEDYTNEIRSILKSL